MPDGLPSTDLEFSNLSFLTSLPAQVGMVRFTENAWTHNSLDAGAQFRAFLKSAGVYDYALQAPGTGTELSIELVDPSGSHRSSTINLGKTNRPDSRFWIPLLPEIYLPADLLSVVLLDGRLWAINLTTTVLAGLLGGGSELGGLLGAHRRARETALMSLLDSGGRLGGDDLAIPTPLLSRLLAEGLVELDGESILLTADGSESAAIIGQVPSDWEGTVVLDGGGKTVSRIPLESRRYTEYRIPAVEERAAAQTEYLLVRELESLLVEAGHETGRYSIWRPSMVRPLLTDIVDFTQNVVYEAKGSSARENVRMGIGQLLDYSRFVDPLPATALLLPDRPAEDLVELLESLGIRLVVRLAAGEFEGLQLE